jgi:hypothetical protein
MIKTIYSYSFLIIGVGMISRSNNYGLLIYLIILQIKLDHIFGNNPIGTTNDKNGGILKL